MNIKNIEQSADLSSRIFCGTTYCPSFFCHSIMLEIVSRDNQRLQSATKSSLKEHSCGGCQQRSVVLCCGPSIWNSYVLSLRDNSFSLNTFGRPSKTHSGQWRKTNLAIRALYELSPYYLRRHPYSVSRFRTVCVLPTYAFVYCRFCWFSHTGMYCIRTVAVLYPYSLHRLGGHLHINLVGG